MGQSNWLFPLWVYISTMGGNERLRLFEACLASSLSMEFICSYIYNDFGLIKILMEILGYLLGKAIDMRAKIC